MLPKGQTLTLNNGIEMPLLGLGSYKTTDSGEADSAIRSAIRAGYRMIDTASAYKNEDIIGRAIKAASVSRKELFITSKIWNTAQRLGDIEGSFQRSLDRLGLDYVDLYLIHWPVPGCYLNTWSALEKLYASGRIRAVGVSNFTRSDLENLAQISDLVPAVNQLEIHPLNSNQELVDYCHSRGIAVQAYAPLARGAYENNMILGQIGARYGKTATQTGLRWMVQKNISVIPKSTQKEHIIDNGQIFDFALNDIEMKTIDSLNENYRSSGIPEDMQGVL